MNHEPLNYNGRTMEPDPINEGLTILAGRIARGDAVAAELEPGDGTYYCLLIVPAWAPGVRGHLGRFGISLGDYLHVTVLSPGAASLFVPPHVLEYDLEALTNAWSRRLLAWWLRGLWEAVRAARLIA